MKTETDHPDLNYTHPVTLNEIMYRNNKDGSFQYLVIRNPCWFIKHNRKVWVNSGMKTGFILIKQ